LVLRESALLAEDFTVCGERYGDADTVAYGVAVVKDWDAFKDDDYRLIAEVAEYASECNQAITLAYQQDSPVYANIHADGRIHRSDKVKEFFLIVSAVFLGVLLAIALIVGLSLSMNKMFPI
jgi:hypothetical protein